MRVKPSPNQLGGARRRRVEYGNDRALRWDRQGRISAMCALDAHNIAFRCDYRYLLNISVAFGRYTPTMACFARRFSAHSVEAECQSWTRDMETPAA